MRYLAACVVLYTAGRALVLFTLTSTHTHASVMRCTVTSDSCDVTRQQEFFSSLISIGITVVRCSLMAEPTSRPVHVLVSDAVPGTQFLTPQLAGGEVILAHSFRDVSAWLADSKAETSWPQGVAEVSCSGKEPEKMGQIQCLGRCHHD